MKGAYDVIQNINSIANLHIQSSLNSYLCSIAFHYAGVNRLINRLRHTAIRIRNWPKKLFFRI